MKHFHLFATNLKNKQFGTFFGLVNENLKKMFHRIELIITSVCFVFACIMIFDIVVYTFKSAPARATFSKRQWSLGLVSAMVVIYFILNGFKFI